MSPSIAKNKPSVIKNSKPNFFCNDLYTAKKLVSPIKKNAKLAMLFESKVPPQIYKISNRQTADIKMIFIDKIIVLIKLFVRYPFIFVYLCPGTT